jgi:N utilization substance protein A
MSEIGEQEKIDIVVWADDMATYITNALSPTNVAKVEIKDGKAKVIVPEDQLSIAIGKSGQNVRLASKLTGLEIDIVAQQQKAVESEAVIKVTETPKVPKLKRKDQLESSLLDAIEEHGQEA